MWKTYIDVHEFNEELDRRSMSEKPHSLLYDFKQYLSKELTKRLNQQPKVLKEDTDLKIANINFAYNNAALLNLLQERGYLIIAGKYGALVDINKRIESFVYQNRDEIIRPVTAFISFETQEGYERAVRAWAIN